MSRMRDLFVDSDTDREMDGTKFEAEEEDTDFEDSNSSCYDSEERDDDDDDDVGFNVGCPKCQKVFPNLVTLKVHYKRHHKRPQKVSRFADCLRCGFIDRDRKSVKKHVSKCNTDLYGCTYCGMRFENARKRMKHETLCGFNSGGFKCRVCDFKSKYRSSVQRHIKEKHQEVPRNKKKRKCKYCALQISRQDNLRDHEEHCRINPKNDPTNSRPTIKNTCRFCSREFDNQRELVEHEKTCMSTCTCGGCGATFGKPAHLKAHKMHCLKLKTACPHCGKLCSKSDFNRHQNVCKQKNPAISSGFDEVLISNTPSKTVNSITNSFMYKPIHP